MRKTIGRESHHNTVDFNTSRFITYMAKKIPEIYMRPYARQMLRHMLHLILEKSEATGQPLFELFQKYFPKLSPEEIKILTETEEK